ncbi:MAG: hypothetical protein L3J22_11185 [Xanthomonadales bacterium]|nr:hypothetical protein [Xanthomonadales bacterium]
MKNIHLIVLTLVAMPVLLGASSKQDTISSCVELAPKNQEFEINIQMTVNTTNKPITKLEISNDKRDDISKSEQEAFTPVRECIFKLIG